MLFFGIVDCGGADYGTADKTAFSLEQNFSAFSESVSRSDDVVNQQNMLALDRFAVEQAKSTAHIFDAFFGVYFVLWLGSLEFFKRFFKRKSHYFSACARQKLSLIIAAAVFVLLVHRNAGYQIKACVIERFQNRLYNLCSQRLCIIGTVMKFQATNCTRIGSVIGKRSRAWVAAASVPFIARYRKLTFAIAAGNIVLLNDFVAVRAPYRVERAGGTFLENIQKLHSFTPMQETLFVFYNRRKIFGVCIGKKKDFLQKTF